MIRQELYELLVRLVECRPETENIVAVNHAHDILRAFLESRGIFCATEEIMGRKTLFAATSPGKIHDFLLNAHIDVVPASRPEQYKTRLEGNILFGRGVGDDLGNTVVIVDLLLKGKAHGFSACGIFTTDEEKGGGTTLEMLRRGYGAKKFAFVLDFWGDGKITCAQKGILSLKLIAHGKGGHASCPWQMDNPIEKLFSGFLKLRNSWKNPTEKKQWADSMTPCVVNAGTTHNQIPDTAFMILNIRYIDAANRMAIIDRVKNETGIDDIEIVGECPPVVFDADANPEFRRLNAIVAEIHRQAPGFSRMNGATDARHLRRLGIPVAILGIKTFGEHSSNEGACMDSVASTVEILERFIRGK